jgi:hypothetical protein
MYHSESVNNCFIQHAANMVSSVFLVFGYSQQAWSKFKGANAQMQNFQSGCLCGMMNSMRTKS